MFSSSLYRVLFQSFFPQNISLLPKNVTEAHANLKKKKTTATLLWQIMWSFSSTPLGSFENKAIKSEDRSMKHPKTCSVIDIQYVRLQNNQFFSQNQLTGYPWENHAKGATVHITELAQTFHIGITWWSIGRYGISFVQASFFSFFQGGGGTLEQPNLHWNMCKFCDFFEWQYFWQIVQQSRWNKILTNC